MKHIKPLKKNKERDSLNVPLVSAIAFIFLALVVIGAVTATISVADWGASHQIIVQIPWDLSFKPVVEIKDREPIRIISPVALEVLDPKEDLTPVEQKIVDKWGVRHGYIALAVFRCESGLRADAVNWETKDVGIAQINFPIWENAIKEEFGYTLVDLFDVDKNLEVAYWVYDRADGEMDGAGNFTPWVVFNTGAFAGCVQ